MQSFTWKLSSMYYRLHQPTDHLSWTDRRTKSSIPPTHPPPYNLLFGEYKKFWCPIRKSFTVVYSGFNYTIWKIILSSIIILKNLCGKSFWHWWPCSKENDSVSKVQFSGTAKPATNTVIHTRKLISSSLLILKADIICGENKPNGPCIASFSTDIVSIIWPHNEGL